MRKLGQKQLTLQLQHRLGQLPAELTAHNLTLSNDGGELIYTYDALSEQVGIADLLKDLDNAGIKFKDLSTTQRSLEDIFVSLVRNDS
jgi:ABC-2 type transport system ATP-binding protein